MLGVSVFYKCSAKASTLSSFLSGSLSSLSNNSPFFASAHAMSQHVLALLKASKSRKCP